MYEIPSFIITRMECQSASGVLHDIDWIVQRYAVQCGWRVPGACLKITDAKYVIQVKNNRRWRVSKEFLFDDTILWKSQIALGRSHVWIFITAERSRIGSQKNQEWVLKRVEYMSPGLFTDDYRDLFTQMKECSRTWLKGRNEVIRDDLQAKGQCCERGLACPVSLRQVAYADRLPDSRRLRPLSPRSEDF